MSQENVEIVRRANALLNAGDWDALLGLITQTLSYAIYSTLPTCRKCCEALTR